MSHRLSRIIPGILLALSAACQDQVTNPTLPLDAAKGGGKPPSTCPGLPSGTSAVVLSPPASEIGVGGTTTLVARNQDGVPIPVCALKWSSSDLTIATVTNAGVVLGVALGGPVTIKAQTSGKKPLVGTAFVTVGPAIVLVEIAPAAAQVPVGGTVMLTATAKDADGNVITRSPVTWVSGDPAVANVGADGTVTGVASGGPVTVTATVEGIAGSAQVTVAPLVASVTLAPATATVPTGQTLQLTATAKDAHDVALPGLPVSFTSSDPAVASVSATGLVTVHAAGAPVTITATIEGVTGTALVTITIPVIAGVELRQVVPDGQGGFYASGVLRSQTTIAGVTLTPADNPDGIILRLTESLSPLWAVHVRASNTYWTGAVGDCCWIAASGTGSVYASGNYFGSATVLYPGGQQVFSSPNGTVEGLMFQLSPSGGLVSWAHLTSNSATDSFGPVATDNAGNVYLAGDFNGCGGCGGLATITTSGGATHSLGAIGASTGLGVKITASGTVAWAVRVGAQDASTSAAAYDPVTDQVVFGSFVNSSGSTATLGLGDGSTRSITCVDGCGTIVGVDGSNGGYRWHAVASLPNGNYVGYVVAAPRSFQFSGGKLFMMMEYSGGPWTLGSATGGPSLVVGTGSTSGVQTGVVAQYSTTGMLEGYVKFAATGTLDLWWYLQQLPGGGIGVPLAFSGTLTFGSQSWSASATSEGVLVSVSPGLQINRVTRLTGGSGTSNGLRGAAVDGGGYLVVTGRAGAGSMLGGSQAVGTGGIGTRLAPGTF